MLNIHEIGDTAMIHVRDHKTPYLIDPWDYLGPKRRKLLDGSWAGLFREHILPSLPVRKIASCYTEGFGRPTKELYAALGSLILQQMHDLTDEETVTQFSFNLQLRVRGLSAVGYCAVKGSRRQPLQGGQGEEGAGCPQNRPEGSTVGRRLHYFGYQRAFPEPTAPTQ